MKIYNELIFRDKLYDIICVGGSMEDRILIVEDGGQTFEYMIGSIIRLDDKIYFTIINLTEGGLLFGEYEGEVPEDDEEALDIIYKDFVDGCKNISYPDGYIVDDLYEMMDL